MNKPASSSWMNETIKSFQAQCQREYKKHEYNHKILYHYTNLDFLSKILSNRTFYFSDFRFLNDSLEFKYSLDLTKEILHELKFQKKEAFLKKLNSFTENPNSINFYVASFCEIPTNLALWRYYADDGYGVAIGIDSQFSFEQEQTDENPIIGYVQYGEDSFKKALVKLINRISKIIKSHEFRKLDSVNQRYLEDFLQNTLAVFIITLGILNKHLSFKEEDEIRLFLFDGAYVKGGFFYTDERKKMIIQNLLLIGVLMND